MNKTLKQIADELGIDKQRVYRFVKKNCINEVPQDAHQSTSPKLYDEAAQKLIKAAFEENEVHQESHHEVHQNYINDAVVDALLKQLDEKDKQINKLQQLLDQEQQLHAGTQQKLKLLQGVSEPEEVTEPVERTMKEIIKESVDRQLDEELKDLQPMTPEKLNAIIKQRRRNRLMFWRKSSR